MVYGLGSAGAELEEAKAARAWRRYCSSFCGSGSFQQYKHHARSPPPPSPLPSAALHTWLPKHLTSELRVRARPPSGSTSTAPVPLYTRPANVTKTLPQQLFTRLCPYPRASGSTTRPGTEMDRRKAEAVAGGQRRQRTSRGDNLEIQTLWSRDSGCTEPGKVTVRKPFSSPQPRIVLRHPGDREDSPSVWTMDVIISSIQFSSILAVGADIPLELHPILPAVPTPPRPSSPINKTKICAKGATPQAVPVLVFVLRSTIGSQRVWIHALSSKEEAAGRDGAGLQMLKKNSNSELQNKKLHSVGIQHCSNVNGEVEPEEDEAARAAAGGIGIGKMESNHRTSGQGGAVDVDRARASLGRHRFRVCMRPSQSTIRLSFQIVIGLRRLPASRVPATSIPAIHPARPISPAPRRAVLPYTR
ncbi:hypothetical protein GALMADRAFT_215921 [Galerina marginata CBS 339.88]|uniref:Uncharacterized protein n=1 Tax=Galerina marginata (strain CBS 339.88) TaxID=685588 RepID=A0A067SDZ4_GALM3|nr:hypothetical protein GALMADRAFT_215921 [Galerina marginata CBS 339.88]